LKHAFLKQYEKFATYLRNELVSNNLADFHLRKGLDHLHAVRERFQAITDRFAGFQAQWLNVHVDFPLLQRLALPITVGAVRYPGIKLHDVARHQPHSKLETAYHRADKAIQPIVDLLAA
jgi:hypothetical protein